MAKAELDSSLLTPPVFLEKPIIEQHFPINEELGLDDSKHSQIKKTTRDTQGRPFIEEENTLTKDGLPAETDANDLEAAHRVVSGPPYSAFSKCQKRYIVFLTAWAGLFSAISATIYFPALNTLAADLKVSNELINLTFTSYMIFQGLAPTVYGDLADMAGRRPAYVIAFTVYIAANVGLALQNSYAALFVLRCLQSSGSSGTIAMGNGVVADIASSSERGVYMGLVIGGPMIGIVIGPIIGGILAQFLGWRSIFWFLVIMAGVYIILFLITFPETGRNIVSNGSIPPQGWNMSLLNYLQTRKGKANDSFGRTIFQEHDRAMLANQRKLRWPNPLNTIYIVLEKDVGMLLFLNSLIYTAFTDVTSSTPSLFKEIYGFNDLQIGFSYIPYGVGSMTASVLSGKLMDINYKRVAKAAGIAIDKKRGESMRYFPIEKARIQVIWPLLYLGLATLCSYGWALKQNPPLAVPLILQFILGFCLTGSFNVISTMLVDLYPLSPATATAANNLVRCFMGAAGTAVIIQMIDKMGRGWCFTFIATVCFVASPLLCAELKWGPKWREERRVRVEKHDQQEESARIVAEVLNHGGDEGSPTDRTNK